MRLLLRAGARYHLGHRWQLALSIVAIALGVAVVVAVDVATGSARRAFALSSEAVSGRATHEVIGGPTGLPDSVYTALRVGAGIDSIAPVIDRYVRLPLHGDATLRLLGVDPFAEAPFRPYLAPSTTSADDGGTPDISALITQRGVVLGAATAARLGIQSGDTIQVATSDRSTTALIAGVLDPADELTARALEDVALADMATAQELTGAFGRLDRIEVRVRDAADVASPALTAIRRVLPSGTRIIESTARTDAVARLTRAFDTNLTALALVALVFGMFLIYNSVTFSLVQRRPLIALLRTQGVTAGELLRLVLGEALVMGVIATSLGIIAGYVLGTQLVTLVARTINDLYFAVAVTSVELTPLQLAKSAVLGVTATVAAALPPALDAVRTTPHATLARASLERRARGASARLAAVGLATAVLAVVLLVVPSRSITAGFGALFVLILAAALLTPAATVGLMSLARPVLGRAGPVARMSAHGVTASLSRTAPAIAALSVAVAVGIAVTVMITSFRAGVVQWLERSLQADIYVSAPGLGANRSDAALRAGLASQVAALDNVTGITTYRHITLLLDEDLVTMIAVDLADAHRDAFEFLDAGPGDAWRAFGAGGVFISEPIAFRRGLGAGDSIAIPTDRGQRSFPIAAVYRDYASEHGVMFIDRAHYTSYWDDRATTSLAVFVAGSADIDEVATRIRALPAATGVVIRSEAGLRSATLEVFDRTFVITGVLRLLALLVAFVGVTGALMALQLERAREVAVLRMIGLTPAQVRALVMSQTALMGAVAALVAVPLGLAMSWAMVNVINRRSFGWTFDMSVGTDPLVQAVVVALGAAVLAGLYPAWQLGRTGRDLVSRARKARPGQPGAGVLFMALLLMACGQPPDRAAPATPLQLVALLGGADTLHARATEPRAFEFPADHGAHPEFRTEWWYFTGSLTAADGRAIGYQLTFFRSALTDSASFTADTELDSGEAGGSGRSAWRARHAWMAHLAVSDGGTARLHASERFARGAVGLAGVRAEPFDLWLGDWRATAAVRAPADASSTAIATFPPISLSAADGRIAIDLILDAGKPIVLQGERGLSRKGSRPGNASYYYSATRMPTRGTITIDGAAHDVRGDSWLDREWSTSVLADDVVGWDWFALQFADTTELMLYRLRRSDGTADPYSAGMFVHADGSTTPLANADFTLTPVRVWSARGYPASWRAVVPSLELDLTVDAVFDAQELVLTVRYWEGMVSTTGTRAGRPISGRGYLEMTGYEP